MSSLLLVSFENLTSSRRETKTPAEPPTDRPRKPRRTSDVKILQSQKSELGEAAIKHLDTRHVLLNRMKPNFNHTPRLLSVALIPHPTHLPIPAFKATESNLFFLEDALWRLSYPQPPTTRHWGKLRELYFMMAVVRCADRKAATEMKSRKCSLSPAHPLSASSLPAAKSRAQSTNTMAQDFDSGFNINCNSANGPTSALAS